MSIGQKVKFKENKFYLTFISLLLVLIIGCGRTTQYNQDGWNVLINIKKELITVKHRDLGVVVRNVHLSINKNDNLSNLSGWNVLQDKDKLIITTKEPENTRWEFKIREQGLDASCSAPSGVIIGIAPSSEDRIPARVASQDNGVMYTAIGLVSAKNIYCLFDRETDILIQFPEQSDLSRNASNEELMNIKIPLIKGLEISLIPDYYTKKIGLARYQVTDFKPVYKPIPKRFKKAPTGWCSWYCYYMAPTEEDMVKETDAMAKKLKPYGLKYVQLDACYSRGEEASYLNWTKETFPKGGKWLFQYIKEKGLKPGLWVNAYGANYAHPECADKYPENFFLRDKKGRLSGACCTADTTVVRLDYTNPEVIEKHLKPFFKTLVEEWGMKYLKDAGWGTWMDYYEENRENAFNPSRDSREVYREVQSVIRDIMGSDNYITGCAMHEVGVGFDFFDGSRTGSDDYATWYPLKTVTHGFSMQTFFNSLFGANYLNGICWWSDPDNVMVREPLTLEEGKTIVSSIALTGQTYMISDFIADFSRERLQRFLSSKQNIGWAKEYPNLVRALSEKKLVLYKKTMPTMPIRAVDLYPFKSEPVCCPHPHSKHSGLTVYPKALDLKVNANSGIYDVVAIYNWLDEADIKEIIFGDDIGLEQESEYLVFDFWNQELIGIFKDRIKTEVPPHGVSVFIIRPLTKNPQLLATSRHITGAYSIKALKWDSSKLTLTGTSETVSDAAYSLFIYVPEGVNFSRIDANALNISHNVTTNRVLEVSFQGQEEPVSWIVEFTK